MVYLRTHYSEMVKEKEREEVKSSVPIGIQTDNFLIARYGLYCWATTAAIDV